MSSGGWRHPSSRPWFPRPSGAARHRLSQPAPLPTAGRRGAGAPADHRLRCPCGGHPLAGAHVAPDRDQAHMALPAAAFRSSGQHAESQAVHSRDFAGCISMWRVTVTQARSMSVACQYRTHAGGHGAGPAAGSGTPQIPLVRHRPRPRQRSPAARPASRFHPALIMTFRRAIDGPRADMDRRTYRRVRARS